MYCSHSLHIFSNYIVNMVVCICWIIADYLGAVHKLFGFPARILYGRPTHIWRSIVPLIHFWVVEGHHPERVLRQFGMKQGILVDVDTSTELHKITLQGKQHQNCAAVHALHIAKWVAHATIADALIN